MPRYGNPKTKIMKYQKLFLAVFTAGLLTISSSCSMHCISGDGTVSSETRNLSSFTRIESNGSLDIFLTQDTLQSVKIETDENLLHNIKTEVHDNKLKIYSDKCFSTNNAVKVYISARQFADIDLKGSGSITADKTITGADMEVEIKGSGDIKLPVNMQSVKVSISGTGSIWLKGATTNLEANISGTGDIKAESLDTKDCKATIKGNGNILVNPSGTLDATIKGSGDIYYIGSPTVKTDISGSGKVMKK